MCNPHTISRPNRLESIVQLLHVISRERDEPIDLYHLHDHFTPNVDEFQDHVADANDDVGYHFGYGRPDLGEFEFAGEEHTVATGGFLEHVWPIDRNLRLMLLSDDEGGEGEDEDEQDEERVSGDVDGESMHTNNTDTTTTAAAEEGEIDTTTNPDTHSAPATSDTRTQQITRSAANNDASARAVLTHND